MERTRQAEGVIKFDLRHDGGPLGPDIEALVSRVAGWRRIVRRLGLIGRDPGRYEGAAFGNLSLRTTSGFAPPGRRSFLVTGTQTSGKSEVDAADFALVSGYDYLSNSVQSRGLCEPSSEAMTHGAIYDLDATIAAVFHAHSPEIWRLATELGLPATDPAVAYGTPEMAAEVRRQFRLGDLRRRSLLVMGGHIDGVMVFGDGPDEAGMVLVEWLARAYSLADASGRGCPT